MSGAPKLPAFVWLPGERALLGEEPVGLPQQTPTCPTTARSDQRRRAHARRRGRGVLLDTAGASGPTGCTVHPAPRRGAGRRLPAGPLARAADNRWQEAGREAEARLPASQPGIPSGLVTHCPRSPGISITTRPRGRCSTGAITARSAGPTSSRPGRSCAFRRSPAGYQPRRAPRPPPTVTGYTPRHAHPVRARRGCSWTGCSCAGGLRSGSWTGCAQRLLPRRLLPRLLRPRLPRRGRHLLRWRAWRGVRPVRGRPRVRRPGRRS